MGLDFCDASADRSDYFRGYSATYEFLDQF